MTEKERTNFFAALEIPEPELVRCRKCGCSSLKASVWRGSIIATCPHCKEVMHVPEYRMEEREWLSRKKGVRCYLERSLDIASRKGIDKMEFLEMIMIVAAEEWSEENHAGSPFEWLGSFNRAS